MVAREWRIHDGCSSARFSFLFFTASKLACFIRDSGYVRAMRHKLIALHVAALSMVIPSLAFGAVGETPEGSEPVAGQPGNMRRPPPTVSATPKVVIVQGPYNLGQAIYNGSYKFKKGAGTHVAEKAHRLTILQPALPAAERQRINPKALSTQLSDREMNALEYYIEVKTGKFVTVSPSWAKKEPPIRATKTK